MENKADQLGCGYEERLHLRKSESNVVLDEFYTWLENLALKTLPQSLLGKAITYAKNIYVTS
ncbi:IS66 family transposase [Anaerosporobacter sp.]